MRIYKPRAETNRYSNRRKKIAVIVFVIVAILSIITASIFAYINKEEPAIGNLQVCDLEQDEVIDKYADYSFDDNLVVRDYLFYGETFSLFEQPYEINTPDTLVGKTILLNNVCTNEEYHYLIDNDVDGQIPLENLPIGLYEVFVNVDLVKRRVIGNEKWNDQLTLVTRSDGQRVVDVMFDSTIFDDRDHTNYLKDDYLFINVSNEEKDEQVYDLVIDPEYGVNDSGYFDNYGKMFMGMVQADEMYAMAEIIKRELEAEGYKVLITRDSKDHIINSYGKGGRLDKAYASKAKYYVELSLSEVGTGGLKVYRSSFASNNFGLSIANHLIKNTNLNLFGDTSLVVPNRYRGLDGNINIRETGGKALGAATYSELSAEANSEFALNNRHALEGISIAYFNINNEEELNKYKSNKEAYAIETAKALINYFKMGELDDISD